MPPMAQFKGAVNCRTPRLSASRPSATVTVQIHLRHRISNFGGHRIRPASFTVTALSGASLTNSLILPTPPNSLPTSVIPRQSAPRLQK